MRDKLDPADPALRGYAETRLYLWVSACLDDGVQELDTMIVTAPASLKSAFCCYDVMAEEIEVVVQRIWWDIAVKRMRADH
ncbi:hypothetical protein GCM10011402_35700 [Paracoccus acridae]|uniref:Uncharacterized protein n=1 Tax=Paracoccus acridae TaxID=1795310 RepID=A0ABQ1VM06_9RHOB|nr:hypothetical protein [Paracoccus acridae]GGF79942.1 hypothetical protein GCM10011402_35700 [Paracoccus acridae]